jgi:hypothetical protein
MNITSTNPIPVSTTALFLLATRKTVETVEETNFKSGKQGSKKRSVERGDV